MPSNQLKWLLPIIFIFISFKAYTQGEIGIGTTTPADKLDVNGAVIVRGAATGTTAGTIQWNSTGGYHEGRLGAGSWRKLENDYNYASGTYASSGCGASLTATIGSGITISSGNESPYGRLVQDRRSQYLILATELTTAGFCAGDFTALAFETSGTAGAITSFQNMTIKMGSTLLGNLNSGFASPTFTTVYSATSVTVSLGVNIYTFSSPFTWDGTSNIAVEVCFDNTGLTTSTNWSVKIQTTPFGIGNKATQQRSTTTTICTASSPTSDDDRPWMHLTGKTSGVSLITDNYYQFNQGVVLGTPLLPIPYESHGPGTITGQAIYDDNTILSDYIFDSYYVPASANYHVLPIDEMIAFMIDKRHLPTINGRDEWMKNGTFSVGELSSQLWATSETHALYLIELNNRLKILENKLNTISKENKE